MSIFAIFTPLDTVQHDVSGVTRGLKSLFNYKPIMGTINRKHDCPISYMRRISEVSSRVSKSIFKVMEKRNIYKSIEEKVC